jgi:23S rRNA (uracil1939-C5)-methyltransferase
VPRADGTPAIASASSRDHTPPAGGVLSASVRRTLRDGEVPNTFVECVHAAACAGCPLIEHDYAQQLAQKRARVVTAASHFPALELVYTRPVEPADPIVGYRGRAKLIVSPRGGIGLYGRDGNHEVVDIPGCRVLSPALAEMAALLRALVADPPAEARALLLPFDPLGGGVLRAVDLREVKSPRGLEATTDGGTQMARDKSDRIGVLLTFVLQRDRAPARDELREAGRAIRRLVPSVVGVAVNFHDADTPQILGSETQVLDGVGSAEDRIGSTWHLATYGSFVQAHREQAARVHALVVREIASIDFAAGSERRRGADEPPRVLDLYGGSGAISMALCHAKNRVTMVESFGPATQHARAAAEAQGLSNLEVRTGDVAEVVGDLVRRDEQFDAVVVNPPRRGVSPSAREAIARIGAPLLVYVSCDPDTLARDLDHFGRLGYSTTELLPLDMIPLTEEVETVCVLKRTPPPTPKVVYEDDEVLAVDKAAHEPVEPHPEYTGSLVARAARLPGVHSSQGVFRLDPGASGLCLLAKTPAAAAQWGQALLQNGRLIYLVAAKGVTPAKGAITRDLREGGRVYSARTRYRRLAVASGHSILRVIPDGGRPHQIRRHLAAIGHPVLGDERYGHVPTNRYFEEKHGLDRTFLHLLRIEISHPSSGIRLLFESTLPGDLRSALERATGSSVLRFLEQKHALGDHRTSSIPPPMGSDDAPPSSELSDRSARPSNLIPHFPDEVEPPLSVPPISIPVPSYPGASVAPPPGPSGGAIEPSGAPSERPREPRPSEMNLDEAPRTRRHEIITPPDED